MAEIIKMNRNGQKPESLQTEPEPSVPEFVTAVGDDSITRFDESRKRRKKKKSPNKSGKSSKPSNPSNPSNEQDK